MFKSLFIGIDTFWCNLLYNITNSFLLSLKLNVFIFASIFIHYLILVAILFHVAGKMKKGLILHLNYFVSSSQQYKRILYNTTSFACVRVYIIVFERLFLRFPKCVPINNIEETFLLHKQYSRSRFVDSKLYVKLRICYKLLSHLSLCHTQFLFLIFRYYLSSSSSFLSFLESEKLQSIVYSLDRHSSYY